MRCAVLYLGRRGAGSAIAQTLIAKFPQECAILSSRNESVLPFESKSVSREIVTTWPRYFLYFSFPSILEKKISRILVDQKIERILLPMPSPLDSKILRGLRKRGFDVVSIVHDAKRHPGDFWPRRIDIKRILAASNYVVTLSTYVRNQLMDIYGYKRSIITIPHPTFDFRDVISPQALPKDCFLFVGRIKKYKGVKLLLEAWKLADIKNQLLVIAGEGKLKRKFSQYPQVKILNKWLSEAEIFTLMSTARIVVFPYLESSQSGLIPLAISLQKRLLVSDLPGLQEQIGTYSKCTFFESGQITSLALELSKISLEDRIVPDREISLELDNGWGIMNDSFRIKLELL